MTTCAFIQRIDWRLFKTVALLSMAGFASGLRHALIDDRYNQRLRHFGLASKMVGIRIIAGTGMALT
jgi:hypothetical protein